MVMMMMMMMIIIIIIIIIITRFLTRLISKYRKIYIKQIIILYKIEVYLTV